MDEVDKQRNGHVCLPNASISGPRTSHWDWVLLCCCCPSSLTTIAALIYPTDVLHARWPLHYVSLRRRRVTSPVPSHRPTQESSTNRLTRITQSPRFGHTNSVPTPPRAHPVSSEHHPFTRAYPWKHTEQVGRAAHPDSCAYTVNACNVPARGRQAIVPLPAQCIHYSSSTTVLHVHSCLASLRLDF